MSIIKNYQSTKGTCKVTFSYPLTESVKTVQVLGDFNDWDSNKAPKMKKGKSDLSTVIELAAGKEYAFRYLLDGNSWANDNSADKYISSPFSGIENSVIVIDNVVSQEVAQKTPAKATAPKATTPKVVKESKEVKAKATIAKSEKVTTPKVEKVAAPVSTKATATKAAKVVAPKTEVTKVAAPKVVKATTKKSSVKA